MEYFLPASEGKGEGGLHILSCDKVSFSKRRSNVQTRDRLAPIDIMGGPPSPPHPLCQKKRVGGDADLIKLLFFCLFYGKLLNPYVD